MSFSTAPGGTAISAPAFHLKEKSSGLDKLQCIPGSKGAMMHLINLPHAANPQQANDLKLPKYLAGDKHLCGMLARVRTG